MSAGSGDLDDGPATAVFVLKESGDVFAGRAIFDLGDGLHRALGIPLTVRSRNPGLLWDVEHAAPLLVVVGPFEQNSLIIVECEGIFEFVEVEVRVNMDGMVVLSLERPNCHYLHPHGGCLCMS